MVIKAVFFDVDGTIIDSEPIHTKAIQDVIKENFGIDLSEEEILKYIGLNYKNKMKDMLNKRGIYPNIEELSGMAIRRSIELSPLVKKVIGAEETIQKMKEDFKIAVVTASSKEQTESLLKSAGLEKYFDIKVTSSDVKRNKPYPDSYLLAAKKIGVKPEECMVIEDSTTGIQAAKNAEMFCIGIRNKYNIGSDFSEADIVIEDIRKINLEMIKGLS